MKRVLILLSNGFEAYEAGAFIDVLGWANEFGSEPIEIITAGLRAKLNCTFGFRVMPDIQVDTINANDFDALAMPGGFEKAGFYEDAYSEDFLQIIRAFDKNKKTIAAICVGSLPLGKSGILANRPATTYHLLEGKRRKQLAEMGARVIDQSVVHHGHIITSTSPATAVDVAFSLLEKMTSRENADHIRRLMGFEPR